MSENWHQTRRRSWWDGSIEAWCGQIGKAGTYHEAWFAWGNTPACPACKTAKKHAKGRS